MKNPNKKTRGTKYSLSSNLRKSRNIRITSKVKKMVEILPVKYGFSVNYTKRLIWFLKDNKKVIQVAIGKNKLFIKIKVNKKWVKINLPDWEDFRRLYYFLDSIK